MVVDTNVLINLMHVGRVDILGRLRQFDFVITEQVAGEIVRPQQQEQVQKLLAAGSLRIEPTSDLPVISLFAELRQQMGAPGTKAGWWPSPTRTRPRPPAATSEPAPPSYRAAAPRSSLRMRMDSPML